MNNKILLAIGVLAVVALYAGGFFGNPFYLTSQSFSFEATSISDTSLTMSVSFSEYLNLKSDTGSILVNIEGDSDLPTTQVICEKWLGDYSPV